MANEFLSAVILLTLVTDPFGNMPLVNAMLSGVPEGRRRMIVVRECLIAYVLLLLFMFSPSQTTFYITPETTKQLH